MARRVLCDQGYAYPAGFLLYEPRAAKTNEACERDPPPCIPRIFLSAVHPSDLVFDAPTPLATSSVRFRADFGGESRPIYNTFSKKEVFDQQVVKDLTSSVGVTVQWCRELFLGNGNKA